MTTEFQKASGDIHRSMHRRCCTMRRGRSRFLFHPPDAAGQTYLLVCRTASNRSDACQREAGRFLYCMAERRFVPHPAHLCLQQSTRRATEEHENAARRHASLYQRRRMRCRHKMEFPAPSARHNRLFPPEQVQASPTVRRASHGSFPTDKPIPNRCAV